MDRSASKRKRELQKLAVEHGFELLPKHKRKRHFEFRHPNGTTIYSSATPSSPRHLMETRASLRRAAKGTYAKVSR